MKTDYKCVPCMMKSLLNLFDRGLIDESKKDELMKNVLKYYHELDFNETPLKVNRNIHRMVRKTINDADPYKSLKDKYNDVALGFYPKYRELLNNHDNPINIAAKLAVAGNIIDFGPGHNIELEKTIEKVLNTKFAIDDIEIFKSELEKANKVLYLADNTGEIVFDKLFIKMLKHPNITLAVRHSPILNDVTLEDVEKLGISKYVNKVITNGDNAPGTFLPDVSDEFRKEFDDADLIISKGQGNFEGLNKVKGHNIFFFLVAKCDIIGKMLGVNVGDFIIKQSK